MRTKYINYRRVSGLNRATAERIVTERTEKPFTNRAQLQTRVKGIGAKVFEQCAGFVRVHRNDWFV